MDYEPGHMRNAQKDAFRVLGAQPVSQGTRVHQAAMYVVYESPWAKMGGNVSDYLREPAFTAFLASIPTLWDETRVLDALEDGLNADRYGADWRRETREVAAADRLTMRMAPGGRWVARFTRE
jgi:alpha-glucosidase